MLLLLVARNEPTAEVCQTSRAAHTQIWIMETVDLWFKMSTPNMNQPVKI